MHNYYLCTSSALSLSSTHDMMTRWSFSNGKRSQHVTAGWMAAWMNGVEDYYCTLFAFSILLYVPTELSQWGWRLILLWSPPAQLRDRSVVFSLPHNIIITIITSPLVEGSECATNSWCVVEWCFGQSSSNSQAVRTGPQSLLKSSDRVVVAGAAASLGDLSRPLYKTVEHSPSVCHFVIRLRPRRWSLLRVHRIPSTFVLVVIIVPNQRRVWILIQVISLVI